ADLEHHRRVAPEGRPEVEHARRVVDAIDRHQLAARPLLRRRQAPLTQHEAADRAPGPAVRCVVLARLCVHAAWGALTLQRWLAARTARRVHDASRSGAPRGLPSLARTSAAPITAAASLPPRACAPACAIPRLPRVCTP